MKGIPEAVADPIEPINEHDNRASVKALLEEHGDKVNKIREGIEGDPLYDPQKHDDLWILRFWLSHKKTKQAIDAAKSTLIFRQKYKLDEKDIRDETPHKTSEPRSKEYWEVRCQGDGIICAIPDKKRGVICFIKFAQMNPGETRFVVAGGVAANQTIRSALDHVAQSRDVTLIAPPLRHCTDNAAMIALAGLEHLAAGTDLDDGLTFAARPRWPLDERTALASPAYGGGKRGAKA